MAMRTAVRAHALHADEALLIGLAGLVLVTGLTLGGGTPLAYLVGALPVVLDVTWSRPVYGFAFLLGVVLLTEGAACSPGPDPRATAGGSSAAASESP